MRILISSHAFAPAIGGIESVSELLAAEFARRKNDVVLVTQTESRLRDAYPFRVVRLPTQAELLRCALTSDVIWHNNLSLRSVWPSYALRRPLVVTHTGSYCLPCDRRDLLGRFKQAIARRSVGVVLCEGAKAFHPSAHVIPNPYDARLFREITPSASRSRDLIFVGRLVSEKGVDVLLQGLRLLADSGLHPTLTIVGKGDERAKLESLTGELSLTSQVNFLGARTGESLVREMNEHRIMVVPSKYDEPFGVVALEGIACGCALVGSEGGGLPAAIGPCGRTFPNGDVRALATVLGQLLSGNDRCLELTRNAPEHLPKFRPSAIADAYLEVFKSVLR